MSDAPAIDASTRAILSAPSISELSEALAGAWDIDSPLSAFPVVTSDLRLHALQALVEHNDALDAFLVTDLANIRALTGFTGSSARLLVTGSGAFLITDARYEERAIEELARSHSDAEVVVLRSLPAQNDWIGDMLRARSIRRLGLEAATISWGAQSALAAIFDELTCIPVFNLVERLRRTKSVGEVARTARAAAIADRALLTVLPLLAQRPTERQFQRSLDDEMLRLGADAVSFETIIASGPNASRPHHEPSGRRIELGDEVICDFGALVDGYHSDMTRTVYIGTPSAAQRHHFNVVRKAHDAGAAALTSGAHCVDVDRAARAVCEEAGWGEEFVHGLGHGTGLVIHEIPWLGTASRNEIAVGDLVTIEPGIYLPGQGGVRLEDLYVITADGPIALTRAPTELQV